MACKPSNIAPFPSRLMMISFFRFFPTCARGGALVECTWQRASRFRSRWQEKVSDPPTKSSPEVNPKEEVIDCGDQMVGQLLRLRGEGKPAPDRGASAGAALRGSWPVRATEGGEQRRALLLPRRLKAAPLYNRIASPCSPQLRLAKPCSTWRHKWAAQVNPR
jgi:hypothetical protein